MDLLRSLLGVGENQPKNVVDDDGEKTTKTGCASGFLCQRAGDPVPSGNICPSCSLPVHPLCEVWNAEQEEHICLLCDKNTRSRFSTALSAAEGVIAADGEDKTKNYKSTSKSFTETQRRVKTSSRFCQKKIKLKLKKQ